MMDMVSYPIGSMYAIYGNIYHQYTPNVSIYTITMDPMGIVSSTYIESSASHAHGMICRTSYHSVGLDIATLQVLRCKC